MKAEEGLMNKEELHGLIEKRQVNVCQICAYKNNQKANRINIKWQIFD